MNNEYFVSTDKSLLNNDLLVEFLTKRSYWAIGRSEITIKKSIDNSLCFGLYNKNKDQVGFGRVISDCAVFAWIMDVFIIEEFRSKGLGKLLMHSIINHADLKDVKKWGLGTRDAHKLYEKFGFKSLSNPELMMEKIT